MRLRTAVPLGTALLLAAALALGGCGHPSPASWVRPSAGTPAPSAGSPSTGASSPAPAASSNAPLPVPSGVVVGVAVFDRQAGTFTTQLDATRRFRSASLVKLLLALDYLWTRGPGYSVPAADRAKLDIMLRSSDDNAATYFYQSAGREQAVTRMISRLGLTHTAAPPAGRGWGTAAFSAVDTVRIYRYLLDEAPAAVRDLIMGNLHQSTKCGTDHYDQSFGIPSAFGRPWAAKQGWYGFGDVPAQPCVATAALPTTGAAQPATTAAQPVADQVALLPADQPAGGQPRQVPAAQPLAAPDVDIPGAVLHTTGTVGAGDRVIIAVLTRHPVNTTFASAAATLTALTRALRVPGASATSG